MNRLPESNVHSDCAGGNMQLAAVALAYRNGAVAPQVTAKGRGAIAEQIIERARKAGIYVHQSRDLVGLLMQVDLDQHIPAQLYVAVAELLAWLYRLERGLPVADLSLPAPAAAPAPQAVAI